MKFTNTPSSTRRLLVRAVAAAAVVGALAVSTAPAASAVNGLRSDGGSSTAVNGLKR